MGPLLRSGWGQGQGAVVVIIVAIVLTLCWHHHHCTNIVSACPCVVVEWVRGEGKGHWHHIDVVVCIAMPLHHRKVGERGGQGLLLSVIVAIVLLLLSASPLSLPLHWHHHLCCHALMSLWSGWGEGEGLSSWLPLSWCALRGWVQVLSQVTKCDPYPYLSR